MKYKGLPQNTLSGGGGSSSSGLGDRHSESGGGSNSWGGPDETSWGGDLGSGDWPAAEDSPFRSDRRDPLRLSLQMLESTLSQDMTPSLSRVDLDWYLQEVGRIFNPFLEKKT